MGEDRQNYVATDLWEAASLQAEKRDRSFGTNYGTISGTNGINKHLTKKHPEQSENTL